MFHFKSVNEYSLDEFIDLLQEYAPRHLYVRHYDSEDLIEIIRGVVYSLGLGTELVLDQSRYTTFSFYKE